MKVAAIIGGSALISPLIKGCGGSSGSTAYSGTINEMTSYINRHMAEQQVTGLSIALVDDQRLVWARGFGYADKENGYPAAADTIYEIGSNTKTFTAAAIMRLQDEGRLDIDQPLTRYLPGFSIHQRFSSSAPITLRSMLTHHSGIPGDFFNGGWTYTQPFGMASWLRDYLKDAAASSC